MPVIKSAKKKLKQDKKKTRQNVLKENYLKKIVKNARIEKSEKALKSAFSALDKAAKNHIIHKNKAAHIKSSLSKLIAKTKPATAVKSQSKTTTKKTAKKS